MTAPAEEEISIRPQPGPQTLFLTTSADIAFYGGSAGGGKSFGLLLEGLRNVSNPNYGFVIFRRTSPEIRNEGGLWDESANIYGLIPGAKPRQSVLEWEFPSGAKAKFAHLQLEGDKYSWQGAQVPYIGFDEITHFSETQFFYLMSRNRSTCGVRPYMRATCNPDATSWVKRFLEPWLKRTCPDPAESGEIRWFVRIDGVVRWWDDEGNRITEDFLGENGERPKSCTFIRSTIFDNQILMKKDPGYLANLQALPYVERRRLLEGDWEVMATAGNVFRREWFEIVPEDHIPPMRKLVRWWDLAATEPSVKNPDPDWTVGALVGQDHQGVNWLLDLRRVRATPLRVEQLIKQTAQLDHRKYAEQCAVEIWMEQEPGSSGVNTIDHYTRDVLQGYAFHGERSTGSKLDRANPFSSQAEHGNVKIKEADWNEGFLVEAEMFPEAPSHDDQIDAASAAYSKVALGGTGSFDVVEAALDEVKDFIRGYHGTPIFAPGRDF